MNKRSFFKNKKAISVMHDAVLFVVMVSLSGVVLIPALQSDTAIDASVQKHREELADETLLMLMTARCNDFGYTLAGEQIEELTPYSVDYSDSGSNTIIENLIKTFLGREQKHKTYSDLCVENLVCQLNVFDNRINIFTSSFDNNLKDELNEVLGEYLGEKYRYNLVTRWRPILGIDYGGSMEIGVTPPENTHVAKTYATLPSTYFSDWVDCIDDFVNDAVDDITSFASDEDKLKIQIKDLIEDIIDKIILKGFNGKPSIINKTVDYVFSPIESGIEKILGDSADLILDPLEEVCPGVTNGLTDKMVEIVSTTIGLNVTDSDGDGTIGCSDAIDCLKGYVIYEIEGMLDGVFDGYLDTFIDFIVETIDIASKIDELKMNITDFIKEHINPLRAEFVITIWEVRS